MALLNPTQAKIPGAAITAVTLNAGGDTIRPDDRTALLVRNTDAGAHTVTVVDPRSSEYGQANVDPPTPIAAGDAALIGPFPAHLGDPADPDRLIDVTYDAITGLDAYLVKV